MTRASTPFHVLRKTSASENAKGFYIWDNDSHFIAEVIPWDEDGKHGGELANLFAAAPDMLEALKMVDGILDAAVLRGVGEVLPQITKDLWVAAHEMIIDAITKAEGSK